MLIIKKIKYKDYLYEWLINKKILLKNQLMQIILILYLII